MRVDAVGPVAADLSPMRGFIAFHLRLAQVASFRAFARQTGQPDLKPGRFAALMVLHFNPGITQTALGRAIARDKSSITPLVKDLEHRRLLERRASANDRRSAALTLTAAGERLYRELRRHARQHDRHLDKIVGDAKEEFLAMLRKISDSLR